LGKAKVRTSEEMERIYRRFAHQFVEPFDNASHLAVIGMQTRGVHIGRRICQIIRDELETDVDFGILDVTFYRDDFRTKGNIPEVKITEIPFELEERNIVLVDDVLYTGRTIRSAMDALMAYGRPESIKFCCMVDRGHRELPVTADYVGVFLPTHHAEEVRVKVQELDHEDAIYLVNTETGVEKE